MVVYTEECFHKSLGRGPFRIILVNHAGKEEIVKEWKQFYASSLPGILEYHFPWADFEVDDDYYDLYGDYTSLEEAQFRPTPNPYELYPYTDWQGEAGPYRNMLSLNELGKAFVRVMEFVEDPD